MNMLYYLPRALATGFVLLGLSTLSPVANAFTISGSGTVSGNLVSASADFSISGGVLTIVLTNTTDGGTLLRSNLLTGVIFDIADAPDDSVSLSLTSIALTSGSNTFTYVATDPPGGPAGDTTVINNGTSLAGTWTSTLGVSPISEFGVSTTGFGGAFFGGGGINGDNYGIAASGTLTDGGLVTSLPDGLGNSSAFPMIQDSLTFTLAITGTLTGDQLRDLRFLFGSENTPGGGGIVVPLPAAVWLLGGALVGLAGVARRKII